MDNIFINGRIAMDKTAAMDNAKMTSGPITRILLSFAGPVLLGQLLQQLYNIADAAIVGQFLSSKALAAVGATSSLTYIVCYFCIGSCIGISVPVSQAYGAGKEEDLRKYFINGVYFALAIAVIMTTVTAAMSGLFLTWLKTPESIFRQAHIYLVIIFMGLPLTVLYNFCFGILMAFGDSKKSTMFMAVSTVMNIFLDLFLVVVVKWGVAGAAVATVFSQGVAGVLSAVYIFRKYKLLFPINKEERTFHPYYTKNIIRMCMPMGLQYSITAIGAIILQFYVNNLGEEAIAGFTSGYKIKNLILCPLNSLGTALSSFVGQNFGAKRFDRISEGFRKTLTIGLIYSVIMIFVCFVTGRYLALIFVDAADTLVVEYTVKFIKYISIFNMELALLFTARYSVQGMGYGKYSILSGLAEMAARAAVAIALIPHFGFDAVCWNEGLTFLAGIIVILPIYIKLFCHLHKSMI